MCYRCRALSLKETSLTDIRESVAATAVMPPKLATLDAMDRFCWRVMTPNQYHGIRHHEVCIVNGPDDKRGVKWVILGESSIWLTENPPQHARMYVT